MARQIRTASSRRSIRSATGGKAHAERGVLCSYHAAPIPSTARPLEITSMVVTCLARIAGLR